MIVITTTDEVETFEDIEVWGGAKDVKETIIERGLQDEAMGMIESFKDTWEVTELNDFIWFDLEDLLFEEEE